MPHTDSRAGVVVAARPPRPPAPPGWPPAPPTASVDVRGACSFDYDCFNSKKCLGGKGLHSFTFQLNWSRV